MTSFLGVIRRIHLWLGLFAGVLIVIWTLSGAILVWLDQSAIRGDAVNSTIMEPELETTSYASPGGIIAQSDGALRVTLQTVLGEPVYRVEGIGGAALFDAQSGEKLSPIKEDYVERIAVGNYIGDGDIASTEFLSQTPRNYRGTLPVWRVVFDDKARTEFFISVQTGEITERRNRTWYLQDFFWALHIFDVDGERNVENPVVRGFSLLASIFALSGLLMFFTPQARQVLRQDLANVRARFGEITSTSVN